VFRGVIRTDPGLRLPHRLRRRPGLLQFEPFSGLVANMQTRAEYLRAEAEKCERQAKKAGSATAMFTLLDLAEDLRRKAA
jgi:hypothetical protein